MKMIRPGRHPLCALCLLSLAGCFGSSQGAPGQTSLAESCQPDSFEDFQDVLGRAVARPTPGALSPSAVGTLQNRIASSSQELVLLAREATSGGTAIPARFEDVARNRAFLLSTLIAAHPELISKVTLWDKTLGAMPPEAQTCLEQYATISGRLEIRAVDAPGRPGGIGEGHIETFLRSDGGSGAKDDRAGKPYVLHFTDARTPSFHDGDGVQASGLIFPCSQSSAMAQSLSPDEALSAPPLLLSQSDVHARSQSDGINPRTFGAQSTAVILLNFQDEVASYTVSDAENMVFTQADGFWRETSHGQTWITGQTFGPYTIAASQADCDPAALGTLAQAAAQAAGVDLSPFDHYVYVFPLNTCPWLGLGTIGGLPSQAWINDSLNLQVVAHELGHNLGLYHSHSLDCGATASIGSSCTSIEYGDLTDTMGNWYAGHYNTFQKERLGWLGYGVSPALETVSEPGSYTLSPYETPGPGPAALKFLQSENQTTGAATYYYLEYRQAWGFDLILGELFVPANLTQGVMVHTGVDNDPNSSDLLQMNPQSSSWYESALNVGQTFTDPVTRTAFTLNEADPTGATLQISLGTGVPPCVPGIPTVTLTPQISTWTLPGSPLSYTVSVQDNDNVACAAATVNLGFQWLNPTGGAQGFTQSLAESSLSLTPGNIASTTLTLTPLEGVLAQPYSFQLSAAAAQSPAPGRSAPGVALVAAPLGMSVAVLPDEASYPSGGTPEISVRVALNGSGAPGAAYTLRVLRPDGVTLTQAGVTDSSGAAEQAYQLGGCGLRGPYTLTVEASAGGVVATATGGFEVL